MLQPDAPDTTPGEALKKIDPETQRIVIFTHMTNDPLAAQLVAAARKSGIEAVSHPIEDDKPLKFDLGGVQSDAAY